jgi:hypothetical protein
MNAPYFVRLLCLSMAAFFLLHLALTAVVAAVAPGAIRTAEAMRPRSGARLLLALRLLPVVLACLTVGGIGAPSYLWLEPDSAAEDIGLPCVAAAILGVAVVASGLARGGRAVVRSSRRVRTCERAAESDAPVLLLAGVFRPRLVISRGVRRALDADQLAVAVRHERAHGAARDNLKRLLILLAPDAIPFVRGCGAIERGWSRLAEWSADDSAVGGSRRQSLALAAALVRVARLGAAANPTPLATSFLGDANDLVARVDRLLEGRTAAASDGRAALWFAAALATGVVALAVRPATLIAAHRLLEVLAH